MAKSQPRILTEEYWCSFALTAEELDYLHQLILDAGIPQTEAFLAYDLVERLCEQEETGVEEEAVEMLPYDPRQEYKVGQEIVVKAQRGCEMVYLRGTVTGRRNVWQANYGNFEAIRVRIGEGRKATSKEYVASAKRGFDGWEPIPMEQVVGEDWGLDRTDEYVAPGEVFEHFQGYVLCQLTGQLGADARFIGFGHEWFVPELLASVSENGLAAVAKRIEQADAPLPLHRLTPVPEMPQQNEEFVQQFSWNDALSRDPRFDNVGTVDTPLWFLRALEPPEAVEKPLRLAIPVVPYPREYQYVHRELKDMEQAVDDEGTEEEAPPPVTAGRVPSVEFVLSFAHRVTGTVPLTSHIRRAFPQADGPRTRITFIDGRSRERMPGWVMHEDRYAWGLREWYDENLIWAGAYIRLETTENPLEMIVDYIPLPQPKEEQVRVARVAEGRLTFEWQTRTIAYKYAPLMLIAETRFEDMEALWLEAEKVGKPIFEVMCDVFPELSHLHPQGHVHARTLYSAVNLVRRCAPGTVFGTLSARPCFDSVGDGYWTYDPDLRDVKVVYQTEKEVEQREKRGTWYDEAKRQAAARKAAETRREREAEPETVPETPLVEQISETPTLERRRDGQLVATGLVPPGPLFAEAPKEPETLSEDRPPTPPSEPAELSTTEEAPMPEPTPEQPAPPPSEPPVPPPPPPSSPPSTLPVPTPRPRGGGAKSLFSEHYLRHRLPDHPEWDEDVGEPLAALRALYEAKRGILPNLNEAQTEAELIRPALEILGFAYIPQASVRRAGRPLRPDYALFADETAKGEAYSLRGNEPAFYARALAVADAKYWERPLSELRRDDARDEFRNTNPSFQIVNYLTGTGVDWGILTNGRTWRLYYRQASSTAHEFYEVDLVEALSPPSVPPAREGEEYEAFKRFWLFFRCDAFTPDAQGNTFLDRVRMGSDTYARVIGDRLKDLVFGEVFPLLAGGFAAYRHAELGEDATSETACQEIYQATLSLLYKLLFLLYAEARDLLPVVNAGYQQKSITRMARQVARRMDRQEPLGTTSTELYDRLLDLFRVIDRGDRGLALPRYNGGLFSARNRANQFLARHKLADAVLAPALDKLARADGEAIDYGFIGVRHLGAIYEGLLEHRLIVGQPEETSEVSEDLGGLEHTVHLETDKGERKATGSYYTPDYIVKYIVAHTLGPIIEERAQRFDELMDQIAEVRRQLADGRRSASIPILRDKLERLEHQARETLLDIKVCDPAMGSGHFLVEAVDLLTDRLIDVLNQYPEHNPVLSMLDRIRASIVAEMERQGIAVDPRRLDDTQLLTRVVMKRCIYGVDLNEMAVELAKVSLWLHTFTVGAPLSFLDHHLRWGNSLIGATVREAEAEMAKPDASGQLTFLTGPFVGVLRAAEVMRGISLLSDATFAELEESERLFRQFDEAAKPYKRLLDIFVARHFGVKRADEFLRLWGANAVEAIRAGPESADEPWDTVMREARRLYEEKRFFHWDLEFPEVFIDLEQATWKETPGFDAVVGNPPYVRGRVLPTDDKRFYAARFVGAFKSYDLYVLFVELGLRILRSKGLWAMIIPRSFLTESYGEAIRKFVLDNARIESIADHLGVRIFDDTSVINCIPTLQLVSDQQEREENQIQILRVAAGDSHDIRQGVFRRTPQFTFRVELTPEAARLTDKLRANSIETGKMCYVSYSIAAHSEVEGKGKDAYLFRSAVNDKCKPFIEGKEIDRYEIDWQGRYLEYDAQVLRRPSLPELFESPKITVVGISGTSGISAAFDEGIFYVGYPAICLTLKYHLKSVERPDIKFSAAEIALSLPFELRYILAVMNSGLMKFYFDMMIFSTSQTIYSDNIRELPLRRIAFTTPSDERVRLVEVGTAEAAEFVAETAEGAASAFSASFSAFSDSAFGRWLDERLSPVHTPDRALVRQHNADPLNQDHQLPEDDPVEQSDVVHDLLAHLAEQMMAMNKDKQAEIKGFLSWLDTFLSCPVDDLSGKTYVGAYHERTFDELLDTLKKNRRRIQPDLDRRGPLEALRAEWETSMGKLRPLLACLAATDRLIDLIVYRLYGLTEDEVAVVEGAR